MMAQNSLKIIQFNCCGITSRTNQTEFKYFLNIHNPDIVLLSETFLKPNHKFIVPYYKIYRTDRLEKNRGGTAILIKSNIKHKTINPPQSNSFNDTTGIKVYLNGQTITIFGIYSTNKIVELDIKNLMNQDNKVLIAGDFNAKHKDWYCNNDNQSGKAVHTFLKNHPHIKMHFPDSHTYFATKAKSDSILDFALSKNINLLARPTTLDDFQSDHLAVTYSISLTQSTRSSSPIRFQFDFSKANWKKFRSILDQNITHNIIINDVNEIEENLKHFTDTITNTLLETVPKTKPKIYTDKISDELIDLIQYKNRIKNQWRKNDRPKHLKTQINMLQRYIKSVQDKENDQKWEERMNAIPPNDRNLFKPINQLTKTYRQIPPLKMEDNSFIHNSLDKANLIAESFEKIYNIHENIPLDLESQNISNEVHSYLQIDDDSQVQVTSPTEIKKIIKKLKNKKAPGHDEITNITLKNLTNKCIILLCKIINAILKHGHFPNVWKHAKVISLPKPGKVANLVQNLRGISLLSGVSKICEKVIFSRALDHFNDNNIIQNEQFGFRNNHSTTQALNRLVEDITIGLNLRKRTVAIFLDNEKAFDTVWHTGLIYKLIKTDTPRYLVRVIDNYLTNRKFTVHLDQMVSNIGSIRAGVPQGSILGPLLYIFYTHDLPRSANTNFSIYADDTAMYSSSQSTRIACLNLQKHLDSLEIYYKKWKLKINPLKTEAIIFKDMRHFQKTQMPLTLTYDNKDIEYKSQIKYLGMTFTSNLKFNTHVNERIKLTNAAFHKLYPALKINSGLSQTNKIRLYKSYIRPILTYAVPAWLTVCKSSFNKAQIRQNKCLRQAINFTRTTEDCYYISNKVLHEQTKVELLKDHALRLATNSFMTMSTSKNPLVSSLGDFDEAYYRSFHYKPPHFVMSDLF